jgi:CRP/FNR family transcriptional regulator
MHELPYEVTAETLERCTFNRIPREDFQKAVRSDSEIASKAARVLAREYREAFLDARRLALSGSAAGRIAGLLLDLAATTASGTLEVHFAVTITHEDLANMVGTSRETVTRLLNKFVHEQLIARQGSTLVILDRDQLSHLAK